VNHISILKTQLDGMREHLNEAKTKIANKSLTEVKQQFQPVYAF
jgi:hypothetical protein